MRLAKKVWWAVAVMGLCAGEPAAAAEFVKFINTVKEGKEYKFQVSYSVPGSFRSQTHDLYIDNQYVKRVASVSSGTPRGTRVVDGSAPAPAGPVDLEQSRAHELKIRTCTRSLSGSTACSFGPAVTLEVLKDAWVRLKHQSWDARKNDPTRWGVNGRYLQTSGKAVGAFYSEWSLYQNYTPKHIPVENLTHIYYAFVVPCGSYTATEQVPNGGAAIAQRARRACARVPTQLGDLAFDEEDKALWETQALGSGDDINQDDPLAGIVGEFYRMKKSFPHIKVLASIGGWSFSDPFFEFSATPQGRERFAAAVANFLERYDVFDGVDIDWEFPGRGGYTEGLQGSPSDGTNNTLMLRETRAWLNELGRRKGKSYELTVAAGASETLMANARWAESHAYLDRINVMTYDFYGPWNTTYGSHSPLYDAGCRTTPTAGLSVDAAIRYLQTAGVPSTKLNVGLASYGKGWQDVIGGSADGPFNGQAYFGTPISSITHPKIAPGDEGTIQLNWLYAGSYWPGAPMPPNFLTDRMLYKIESGGGFGGIGNGSFRGANGYELFRDDCAKAEYLWNPAAGTRYGQTTGTLISLDTPYSVSAKSDYVRQRGLGGVFMWEIKSDPSLLLNYANRQLGNQAY
jgi:chitinase